MGANDLTTLANLKMWLIDAQGGGTATNLDPLLSKLITSTSQRIIDYLERFTIFYNANTDYYDGTGGDHQFMRYWPVLSISEVLISGEVISPAPMYDPSQLNQLPGNVYQGAGYRWEGWDGLPPGQPQAVELIGYRFYMGRQNVKVSYISGYVTQGEAQTIPASPGPYTLVASQKYGTWMQDNGVVYTSSGLPLTYVASAPTAGQYSHTPNVQGGYTFSAADQGLKVLLTYSYVPSTVEEVVWQLISDTLARRNRPGVKSKNLATQEAIVYDLSGMPDYARMALQPYRSVLPI